MMIILPKVLFDSALVAPAVRSIGLLLSSEDNNGKTTPKGSGEVVCGSREREQIQTRRGRGIDGYI